MESRQVFLTLHRELSKVCDEERQLFLEKSFNFLTPVHCNYNTFFRSHFCCRIDLHNWWSIRLTFKIALKKSVFIFKNLEKSKVSTLTLLWPQMSSGWFMLKRQRLSNIRHHFLSKLCNQVRSLSLFRWRTLTLLKI